MKRILSLLGKLVMILLIVASICSCRSIKYVPVETIKHDSVYVSRIKFDSIYQRDSVYVYVKGDTVYTYKYQYRYRDKLVRDTINVNRTDSIPYAVEVEKRVEKDLNWFQTTLIWTGGTTLVAAIVALLYWINKKTNWISFILKLVKKI